MAERVAIREFNFPERAGRDYFGNEVPSQQKDLLTDTVN